MVLYFVRRVQERDDVVVLNLLYKPSENMGEALQHGV